MAAQSAWPSIREHGLLSAEGLADLYRVRGAKRHALLGEVRRESITLKRLGMSPAIVRDQKPMKFIHEKIEAGSTLEQYLAAINARVFFWPTRERLERLTRSREYADQPKVVLHVSTSALVDRYGELIELCRFNSGAVTQKNHPPRGHQSWVPVRDYRYDEHRAAHGPDGALAEVTVRGSVPDVLDIVTEIERIP
ncbi:hypothetical protein ESP70_002470 [Aeromicrobium ginsengisoli]|uniref:Uncharacterized protein n=2 Tax=Aeromicrobium ginsengisoli TaxID=363867 RepID=A0A5M4FJ78_9ACTN|nr:hypothetical protein [Aeromicrobium ginsengisoli]KAA1399645.1 hypothetical protein ESP70_002470 [Aeromicrobium ginsengisoli]